jgi:D-erythro-7,8-dihydroneopterin triphosphate epimerase
MATIYIKNLRLRTIIGIEDGERTHKQDIIINAQIEVNIDTPAQSDNINDAFNYKTITKKIIEFVESSDYFLLEKLVDQLLKLIMQDEQAITTTVEVDKPAALRFSDSVSIKQTATRKPNPG